jgi:hypothetical protein
MIQDSSLVQKFPHLRFAAALGRPEAEVVVPPCQLSARLTAGGSRIANDKVLASSFGQDVECIVVRMYRVSGG